ncbi:MAG: MFS transporter, partial [Ardenticatenaceae bacterium]
MSSEVGYLSCCAGLGVGAGRQIRHVIRSRELWLIGLGSLCFWACVRGFVGYLPIYLKTIGWNPVLADQTLAIFYALSLIGVVPLSILSDRLGIRRELMILSVSVLALGVFIFSFAEGLILWLA